MGQLVTNRGLLGNSAYVDRRAAATVKTLFIFCFFIYSKPTKFRHVSTTYFPLRPCKFTQSLPQWSNLWRTDATNCWIDRFLILWEISGADKYLTRPGRKKLMFLS